MGGGEAFFCPRRLPSWENARGERWPYAGAPLTIRIYEGAPLTIRGDTTPAIGLPLPNSLIYGTLLTTHTVTGLFSRSSFLSEEAKMKEPTEQVTLEK